jgi:hypothetical protein
MLTPSLIKSIADDEELLEQWIIDVLGNIAVSAAGLGLLARIDTLVVPVLTSTEQALEWGSQLDARQRATLIHMQRTASNAAHSERNVQCRVNLATKSQLMREAAEAPPSDSHIRDSLQPSS